MNNILLLICFCLLLVNTATAQSTSQYGNNFYINKEFYDDLEEAKKHTERVQSLKLSLHDYKSFPEEIFTFSDLRELVIEDWNGKYMPDKFDKLTKLEKLRLEDNDKLVELPASIGSLNRLEVLGIVDNTSLKTIPETIYNLPLLELLWIEGEGIRYIPDGIEKLQSLKCLIISSTEINTLPISVYSLINLRYLNLDHNEWLLELSSNIQNLEQLVVLELKGTKLRVPYEIKYLRHLKHISASNIYDFKFNDVETKQFVQSLLNKEESLIDTILGDKYEI